MKNCVIIHFLLILLFNYQIAHAQQNIAQETYTIFEKHCLDCHGEFGSYADVLTIKHSELIEVKSVIPRQPDTSELYLRLLGDTDKGSQMPLGQEPLDAEAIATIRRWIEAGAPDWEAIPKPKRNFITTEAMLKSIHTHLTSLSDFDRSFARYFTLTHLYNAGTTDANLRAYRIALSKLINSLSWGAEVIKPKSIDRQQTIFYIDLRNYEWDIETDKWYKIEQAYPYGVQLKSETYTALCQEADCELPFIRADWFIANASLPPLYHDILDLPKTDRELETQLEVNVSENLKNAPGVRVWRAGFSESGVSVNNRIVERHKSRYGAYWKSYDFAGNVGKQNIFTHPLDFTHDGGEIIFNLPNGLQAYYLSTATGERLDEAPINIVSDAGARDPVVRNGLSCMGCHTEGMKAFDDQVHSIIEQNLNPSYDKAYALRLYAEKSTTDRLVRGDMARYRQAIEAAGGVFGGIEPIQQLVKQFEGPLDAAHAAAEVGMQTDDFLKKIRENSTLQDAGLLVLEVEDGSVKRDSWESQFDIIVFVLELEQYASAIEDFNAVLRINPNNARAYSNRGLAKYRLGQYDAAIEDYNAALRINPDDAEVYYNRGILKGNLGLYDAAIEDYTAALRVNPDDAEVYYNRGILKDDLGQYDAAIEDYTAALRVNPNNVAAYLRRGWLKYELEQYDAAIADFDAVLRINPDDAEVYYKRGNAKYNLGQYDAAIADFDAVLRINPNDVYVYHSRGNVKYNLGQYDAAIADYTAALRIDPNDAEVYYGRGISKYNLGQYDAAIADFDAVLRIDPDDAEVYYGRGISKYNLGQYDAAIADFDAVLQIHSSDVEVYYRRGLSKHDLGRYDAAIEDYNFVLRVNLNDTAVYNNRGNAKYNLRQYDAAIADYNAALCINPNYAKVYYNRGDAKCRLKQYASAIEDYNAALRINPKDAAACFNRGFAKYELDRVLEAKQDFQTALKLAGQVENQSLKNEMEQLLQNLEIELEEEKSD